MLGRCSNLIKQSLFLSETLLWARVLINAQCITVSKVYSLQLHLVGTTMPRSMSNNTNFMKRLRMAT
jgi:hypothetical protein